MPDPAGRVKACTECRQQKVKCDAFKDYTRPCSRCRAAGLPCVITRDFQRRPRQTKAQLQHELDRLRAQSEIFTDQHVTKQTRDNSNVEVHAASSGNSKSPSHSESTPPSQQQPESHSSSGPSLRELLRRSVSGDIHKSSAESEHESPDQVAGADRTVARTLRGVTAEPGKINECYASFLSNYALYTHGLVEMVVSPNERYKQSPLLFWVIICVGARSYTKDLTLYERLAEPVIDLMFASLIRPQDALPVIQAAVILCRWPFPVDLTLRESSQAIAGAALCLALQNGLHMYSQEQDFVLRSLTEKLSVYEQAGPRTLRDEVATFRSRMWAYCIVTFQHVNLGDGLPPISVVPCFRYSESGGSIYKLLPERLSYELRLHHVQKDATNSVCACCDVYGDAPNPTLNAMIILYDDNLQSIALPQDDIYYRFLRSCARVSVMALLFVVQTELDNVNALRLYRICLENVHLALELERDKSGATFYCPQFYIRMVLTSVHVLMRVVKSPLGDVVDTHHAKTTMFAAVRLFRQRKTSNTEILSRQLDIIPQLWSSNKAFVWDEHGPQNGLRVNARYRLMLTPIFDNIWWWRKEFGKEKDELSCASLTLTSRSGHASAVKTQFDSESTTGNHSDTINPQNSRSSSMVNAQSTATAPSSQASRPAVDIDLPMSMGDGLWTQSMDTIFADFMQWWDVSNLQADVGEANEILAPQSSSFKAPEMGPANYNQHPQHLTSGANRLI